ncbi:MAG: PQQ-binding-like beta-propeller repeat protein [Rhodomicrobium sp.]
MMRKRSNRGHAGPFLLFQAIPLIAAVSFGLAGCESMGLGDTSMPGVSSVTTMFDKKQEPLPGRRISVLKADEKGAISGPESAGTVVLPPAVTNAAWSQPGGVATNAPGHLAIGEALKTVWTADAGEGSSKRTRLTAIPIVYNDKIYTMDSEGSIRALSVSSGATLWQVKTIPEKKAEFDYLHPFNTNNVSRGGFGGGLAADGGKVYAATGYGGVLALDAGSGQQIWSKQFAIPIREAPTAAEGRVFVVNSESELLCLSAADGSQLWVQKGLPENAALLTSASPAVAGNMVFVPYPSGEITAVDIKSGQPKWTDSLAKGAINTSATAIGEAARPVVDRDAVFAMSRGGELIATSRDKGQRLWTREIRGSQMPWVAGDSIFVVDMTGKLVALNRKDGKVRWVTALPGDGHWSGPVLAGNRLWLASSKGLLVAVDAVTGTIGTQSDLGTPVMITPVVAEGRLYLLTDKAKLIAMN